MHDELSLDDALDDLLDEGTTVNEVAGLRTLEHEEEEETQPAKPPPRFAGQYRIVGGEGMPSELPWLRTERW